jgi:hypothetical protein
MIMRGLQLSLLAIFSVFSFYYAVSSQVVDRFIWPKLPDANFVKGRAATKNDVDSRRAVFAYIIDGKVKGKPLKITVPQYGIVNKVSESRTIRVIVVQAELVNEHDLVGYVEVKSGKRGISLLKHVKLLGDNRKKLNKK